MQRSGLLEKLDALFFAFSVFAAAWLAFLLLDQGVRKSWQVVLLVIFWFVFTYLFLPRLHKMMTQLYLPGYFIGRARTSDGLLGDPINLGFVGSEADIHRVMAAAGWTRADDLDVRSGMRIVTSTLRRQSYREAPVSPLHLFKRQQDFAYQQEVAGSPSKRHHVRFWRCPDEWLLPGGWAVDWLAAGTYDRSVGLSLFTLQITHKIEENIDVERDFIVTSMVDAEPSIDVELIENFSTGYHSRNGGGDRITTDGDLPILDLGSDPAVYEPIEARTDSRDRRPASTTFGAVVTFLRGIVYVALAAQLFTSPDVFTDLIEAQGLHSQVDVFNQEEVTAWLLLISAVIDCGLGLAVLAGRNWARVVLMSACVLSSTIAFVANYRGTDSVTLTHLPTVGLSILVLLALTSPRARDYAERRTVRQRSAVVPSVA